MTQNSKNPSSKTPRADASSKDIQSKKKAVTYRKLKEKSKAPSVAASIEHPVLKETESKEKISESEKTRPAPIVLGDGEGREKRAESEKTRSESLDLSSLRTEFQLRIGSQEKARKLMNERLLTMVIVPAVFLLILICGSILADADLTKSMTSSLHYIMAVICGMTFPLLLTAWANGLYPKGSFGRFVAGSIFALLLGLWLALILLGSNLQAAFVDSGMTVQLDRIFVIVCPMAIFILFQAIFDLIDNRKQWRKSIGADIQIKPLDLGSKYLEFDLRIGKFQKGNAAALNAYIRYLITPTILLVAIYAVIEELNLGASDVLKASIGSMFGMVLLFGLILVSIYFLSGYYPKGSYGRMAFGLMAIPVEVLFAWGILIGSGIQDALARNGFIINMNAVLVPIAIYILFMTTFKLSEFADNRRGWHLSIGKPLEPYDLQEDYRYFDDFRARYATFLPGARKARDLLGKYVFRRVLIVMIAGAIVVSLLPDQPMVSNGLNRFVNWLLLIAVISAPQVFLSYSYRKGSFARMLTSLTADLFLAVWAYVIWTLMIRTASAYVPDARIVSYWSTALPYIVLGLQILMVIFIAWAGIKAFWAWGTYVKNRRAYLGWRLSVLGKEVTIEKPPAVPAVPLLKRIFAWRLPHLADTEGFTTKYEGEPSRMWIPAPSSRPSGVASADLGNPQRQNDDMLYSPTILQKPYGVWTKEMIIDQLKVYVDEYESTDLMRLRAPHLYMAINTKFGKNKSSVKEPDPELKNVIPTTEWSKERIIRDIQQLHDMGEDLSASNIQNLEPNLVGTAPKYFGSWKGAIKAAGYDYDGIRRDWIFDSFQESKFLEYVETALKKSGSKARPEFTLMNENQSFKPDLYDPDTGSWIAVKLDAGSYDTHLAIQKYVPFTEKITIIYLKGRPRKRDADYAQFVNIRNFYDKLSNTGSEDLIMRIESLNDKQLGPELRKDFHNYIRKEHPEDRKSEDQILKQFSI